MILRGERQTLSSHNWAWLARDGPSLGGVFCPNPSKADQSGPQLGPTPTLGADNGPVVGMASAAPALAADDGGIGDCTVPPFMELQCTRFVG